MKCNKNDSVANSFKYVHCLSLQLHKHAAAILRHDVLWASIMVTKWYMNWTVSASSQLAQLRMTRKNVEAIHLQTPFIYHLNHHTPYKEKKGRVSSSSFHCHVSIDVQWMVQDHFRENLLDMITDKKDDINFLWADECQQMENVANQNL